MIPVFSSAFARRMSAVVRTGVIKSLLSANQRFHCAMWRIVPTNPSQIEHVQFAAVNPPLRISANTARLHFETTRPSMTVSESCKPVIQFPGVFSLTTSNSGNATSAIILRSPQRRKRSLAGPQQDDESDDRCNDNIDGRRVVVAGHPHEKRGAERGKGAKTRNRNIVADRQCRIAH